MTTLVDSRSVFVTFVKEHWFGIMVLIAVFLFNVFGAVVCRGDENYQGEYAWNVNIVARTIWREGRGDGKNGMYAVACVIQKRTLMKSLSAADVCLRRRWDKKASRWTYWFSCWSKATAKDKDYRSLPKTEEARFAQELAKAVVDGEILNHDFVKDADHYCTLDTDPYWADGVEPVAVIGNHKYFKLGQC